MRKSGNKTTVLLGGLAFMLLGVIAGTSADAAIAWTNASGSNAAFGWSGGQNTYGPFGNPVVSTRGFDFFAMNNFRAVASGGLSQSSTDSARVSVSTLTSTPANAPAIHQILVEEWGTWSAALTTMDKFTVQADFQVFRTNPSPPGNTGSLSLTTTFNPDGTWYASRLLVAGTASPPYSNADWKVFQLTVTNTIQVDGTAPSGSFIEKTGMRVSFPEPTTLSLLGILLLTLRRKRY